MPSTALLAGSTKPNYPALKMQAERTRSDLHGADSQWTWLSRRMSDKAFALKYDEASRKHDVAGLNQFLKTSGFTFNPFRTTDQLCSGKVCLGLPAGMDDWERRKSQHAPLLSKLDSFFSRISQDKAFGEKFEQLVMRKNQQGLIDFCRGAGLGDIQILAMDSDVRIHFKCSWFEIDISW